MIFLQIYLKISVDRHFVIEYVSITDQIKKMYIYIEYLLSHTHVSDN
jgi:hypothetical protein